MAEKAYESPFYELPEALVEEMLNECNELGNSLSISFKKIIRNKRNIRKALKDKDLLKRDSDIFVAPANPTSSGVDGSYAIEKLIATDIVAIAAVAVEGLTPPTEKRFWPKPHHFSRVLTISHSDATAVVSRAVMMSMELILASRAPHDVVFLDGSLTTPFIYFNQALSKIGEVPRKLSELLIKGFTVKETDTGENVRISISDALVAYREILLSLRSDKNFVGVPKYTTRREITQRELEGLNMNEYEDRGMLSFVLEPGEYIKPIPIQEPQQQWHITLPEELEDLKELKDEIISALNNLYVMYYRPYIHFPAIRMEISKSITTNPQRLAILFESVKLQSGAPGIVEPYPLYLADRMVKHLSKALPAIRKAMTQEMALTWEEELGVMYLAMHGYRTEYGK